MKHGGTQQEYSETKYKCMQEAQQREAYVNEHTGVAESSVVTNQELYAACMNADGWYLREAESGVK